MLLVSADAVCKGMLAGFRRLLDQSSDSAGGLAQAGNTIYTAWNLSSLQAPVLSPSPGVLLLIYTLC